MTQNDSKPPQTICESTPERRLDVVVCIVCRDENPRRAAFENVDLACRYAQKQGIATAYGMSFSGHSVDHSRNRAVAGVLESPPKFVLMVDDDVLIPEDTIPALLACEADIAGGCYPGMKRIISEHAYVSPCVLVRPTDAFCVTWFDGIIDCTAVSGGCMLIKTDVFEKVGFPWFRWPQTLEDGDVIHKSDDIDFCDRAREAGCTIKAHGNVRCSHLKDLDLSLFIAPPGERPWVPRWRGPQSIARQQAPPDYGSHIPVLQALGKHLNSSARRIVEYGCGKFSTPVFCDREFYEHAESIVSHESDPQWISLIEREIRDRRLTIHFTPVAQMSRSLDPDADVVLIDCDYSAQTGDRFEVRRKLIAAYAQCEHPVVIVHDSNFRHIRPAVDAAPFKHRFTHVPQFGPQTTVLSNRVRVEELTIP